MHNLREKLVYYLSLSHWQNCKRHKRKQFKNARDWIRCRCDKILCSYSYIISVILFRFVKCNLKTDILFVLFGLDPTMYFFIMFNRDLLIYFKKLKT